MKITLLSVGKTDEKSMEDLISKYENRFPAYWNYQRIEIPDLKNRKNLRESQQKEKEGERILSKLGSSDYVILLDEGGKMMDSKTFARKLDAFVSLSSKNVVFVIGGPYGFSEAVYERGNLKLSLSEMTFTHQMVRLFLVEQLYRAFAILHGKPYHHE